MDDTGHAFVNGVMQSVYMMAGGTPIGPNLGSFGELNMTLPQPMDGLNHTDTTDIFFMKVRGGY